MWVGLVLQNAKTENSNIISPLIMASRNLDLLLVVLLIFAPIVSSQSVDCFLELDRFNDLHELQADQSGNGTACLVLANNSRETLASYFSAPLYLNLSIQGNNSTIVCDSNQEEEEESELFTLYVSNASQVFISDLHFEGCTRPLYLNLINNIQVISSSFRNFSPRGAVEIAHSPSVSITNCTFINCESRGSGQRQFSGNAGGLAIGYSPSASELDLRPPRITVTDSLFANNKAMADAKYRYNVLRVLRDRVYNQRGGGIAFYLGANNYSSEIEIGNCMVMGNAAEDSGGGIYVFLGGIDSNHTVRIINSEIVGNKAQDGGGLEITHSNPLSHTKPNNIKVINTNFVRNEGSFGGGYKNIQLDPQTNLNNLLIKNCTFYNNTAVVGAAVYLQSVETVDIAPLLKRITLDGCNYEHNNGKRGTVFVIGNVITITGISHFEGNIGPVLRVLGTLAALEGNISFFNNRFHPEGFSGAIYLSSFGQMILHEGVHISFVNNTGRDGASIVVKGQLIAAAFTRQLYNPQCFLQYIEPTVPPPKWNVSMLFEGNKANVGPVVLMPDSKICEWNNISFPFFADTVTDAWCFMEMRTNYVTCMSDEKCVKPSRYIQTGVTELQVTTNYTEAYPGESVSITAQALDQFNHTTSAFIAVGSPDDKSIVFEPRVLSISPMDNKIVFQYSSNNSNTGEYTNVTLEPVFTTDMRSASLTLRHESCLPGYTINSDTNKCSCTETEEIILCQEDGKGLLLADGIWGASINWSRTLVTYPCPPKYCNCVGDNSSDLNEGCQYLYDDENSLCATNREGLMCGKCESGHGVGLLTNNCREYNSLPQFWIFPIYIVFLVVVLVVLVKLGVHMHPILRGFILYAQLSPIAVAYFPDSYNMRQEFMSCISSIFALYIPYDFSFHTEMSSLESYGLRLVTPLIAMIVVPLAARFRQHRFKYWHGIWTIVILMYIMSVETSFSLVYCPVLNSDSGKVPNLWWYNIHGTLQSCIEVWFYDGNITCFTGWHIPLFLMALVCVVVLFLLIPFVSASVYYETLRKKYAKFDQLERFSIVVTRGIKQEYKWWPIAELGYRYVFVAAAVLAPGFVVVPLIIASVAFVFQTTIHPYKSRIANYVDSLFLLWLVGLLGLGNTTALKNSLINGNEHHTRPLWILLYLPALFGFTLMGILAAWKTRKVLIENKEKIKNFLKMRFAGRGFDQEDKKMAVNGKDVTNTVVGLEDSTDTGEQPYTAFL